MAPWPPEGFEYSAALEKGKYRLVDLDDWETAPDTDDQGFTKVYPVSHFEGGG